MRIAIVTSSSAESFRGNFSTVQRWMSFDTGHEVVCISPDAEAILEPVPDIIHGYHALHGGIAATKIARRHHRPLVVSLGGTDLWRLMNGLDGADDVEKVLRSADCITGAFDSFGDICREILGDIEYVTVPRSVKIPDNDPAEPDPEKLRVVLPAGLRRVKDLAVAIDLAAALVERELPMQLTILGPVVDEEYAEDIEERAMGMDFINFDLFPLEKVHEVYESSDVCWNTSLQEGGANSLLEAMACGCAVFARDVVGNREYFSMKGAPAKLFDPKDIDGAECFHRSILTESVIDRNRRVDYSRAWLKENHFPKDEAIAIVRAWEMVSTLR